MLILRDLLGGSQHFNDLRKGVPLMSPSLLSKRLKSLEEAGVIERRSDPTRRATEYHLTAAGHEMQPMILLFGSWGQRWVRNRLSEDKLDVGLLMWAVVSDIRSNIDSKYFSDPRTVVQFEYSDITGPEKIWWLIVEPSQADLCIEDPGFDVDLFVYTDLATLTRAWMGDIPLKPAVQSGAIELHGLRLLVDGFDKWMRRSPFATVELAPEPLQVERILKEWAESMKKEAVSHYKLVKLIRMFSKTRL